jgi:hypothetical protein
MNVTLTKIGTVELGIDGADEYVLLKSEDDMDADAMHNWLLELYYRQTNRPGGYFCTSVLILPHPNLNTYVGAIQHRYDV